MEITTREALNQALREEMQRDERVFIVGEDVAEYDGAYKVSRGLLKEFGPGRVMDTPISEEVIAGVGVGSALVGFRPVVEFMTVNFSLLAMDQIINHAAKWRYMSGGQFKVPVVFRMPGGAGLSLGAQHSHSLEAIFTHIPGLKVVAPGSPRDAKGLLKSAIRDDDPVIFLENEMLYNLKGEVPEGEYLIPLGLAEVKREGSDVTLIAYRRMLQMALMAADLLAKEGIEAEVVDPRTLRPLDLETLVKSVRKTGRAVVVHEGWARCGVGGDIANLLYGAAFDHLDAPIQVVSAVEVPMPYNQALEQAAIPSPEKVAAAARAVLSMAS
jgi:pyruvate/2-oxoglutarate/acetoin dehydrogenase E1 component